MDRMICTVSSAYRRSVIAQRVPLWVALVSGLVTLCAVAPAPAGAQDSVRSVADNGSSGADPSDPACASGRVSEIDIDSRSIYDPTSTNIAPLAWTYRLLNLLHVNTSHSFIRGELLLKEGDCFDSFLMSESYRLLDQHSFMYVDSMTDNDDGNGGHKIHVITRDEWSTKVDIAPTYEGGINLERFQATEENFLGHGVFAEFTYYARRETRTHSFGLRTPRFFGRSDAGIAIGTSRPGRFFDQYWRYPFVGDAGRVAVREGYDNTTDFFAYSTDGSGEQFTQVLLPVRREFAELSGAYRLGRPGALWILGASLTRDQVTFPNSAEITYGDFDVRDTFPGALPPRMQRQLRDYSATRASLHLGLRTFRYVEYTGIDALREQNLYGLGVFAGLTVGKGLGFLIRSGAPADNGFYTRGHLSITEPLGLSLLRISGTLETRRDSGAWRDILADADLAFYGRASALPGQTLFFRASTSGGWNTTLPFQLSLGGREGVRSLDEDRYPGGRMVRFIAEDRIALPWPTRTADLGLTLFSDLGRVWAGDAPYGVNSGWQAALGFGLRLGVPRRTRHIWRLDIAFPAGPTGGSPIFRASLELNKLRSGFFTPDVERSRRFTLGPDTF